MKNETQNAYLLATEVHGSQVDKGGEKYLGHVLRVAKSVVAGVTEGTMMYDQLWLVAILHDTVEDVEGGQREREEIEERIINEQGLSTILAVQAITHMHWVSEPFLEYLERVKRNELARQVKIADIKDNMDPIRALKVLRYGTEFDFKRLTDVLFERYIRALDYLNA